MSLLCPMAFFSLTVHPTNVITSCMLSENKLASVGEKDGLDNEAFQDLRQNMFDGKWSKQNCATCMVAEQKGLVSSRMKWGENARKLMEKFNIDWNLTNNPIGHLNINLNNVCNFKCRMCGPKYSNAWIPDAKHLKKQDPSIVRDWNDGDAKQFVDYLKLLEMYGDRMGLQSVWVTGGEPFIDNQIFDVLHQLKKYANPGTVNLNITTNGSKINLDKIKELHEFKEVVINVSVDATGELFSYMRSAGVFSFDDLCKNIKALKEIDMPNLRVQINASHQIYNSLNILDFYKTFTEDIPVSDIEMRTLSHPLYLDASIMPDSIKTQAIEQAETVLKEYNKHKRTSDDLESVIKNLQFDNPNKILLWKKFNHFTNLLDKRRKHFLKNVEPRLAQ